MYSLFGSQCSGEAKSAAGRPNRSLGRDGMCELTGAQHSHHSVLRVVGGAVKDCTQGTVRHPGA